MGISFSNFITLSYACIETPGEKSIPLNLVIGILLFFDLYHFFNLLLLKRSLGKLLKLNENDENKNKIEEIKHNIKVSTIMLIILSVSICGCFIIYDATFDMKNTNIADFSSAKAC